MGWVGDLKFSRELVKRKQNKYTNPFFKNTIVRDQSWAYGRRERERP